MFTKRWEVRQSVDCRNARHQLTSQQGNLGIGFGESGVWFLGVVVLIGMRMHIINIVAMK